MRLLLLSTLLLAACGSDGAIIDDWGPPAGYTAVRGTVRDPAGTPIAGLDLSISRCSDPIGGLLGMTTTDATGHYAVTGVLPPIGLAPATVDTMRVSCSIGAFRAADHSSATLDTITIRFYPAAADVVPAERDVTFH